MKTAVEIEWDKRYVAKTELQDLAVRMEDVIMEHFFVEGLPMWAKVVRRVEAE